MPDLPPPPPPDAPFVCEEKNVDGTSCNRCFKTKQALWRHQHSSKLHQPVWGNTSLVITNQCPRCKTVMSSYRAALQHLKGSEKQGYCIANKTYIPHTLRQPKSLHCKMCDMSFENVDSFNHHACEHHLAHIVVIDHSHSEGTSTSKDSEKAHMSLLAPQPFGSTDASQFFLCAETLPQPTHRQKSLLPHRRLALLLLLLLVFYSQVIEYWSTSPRTLY